MTVDKAPDFPPRQITILWEIGQDIELNFQPSQQAFAPWEVEAALDRALEKLYELDEIYEEEGEDADPGF